MPSPKSSKSWSPLTPIEQRQFSEKRLVRSYLHFPDTRSRIRPLMDDLKSPLFAWAWTQIQGIEANCEPAQVLSIFGAILCVSPPHYLEQLRPLVYPTIDLSEEQESLGFIIENLKELNGQA